MINDARETVTWVVRELRRLSMEQGAGGGTEEPPIPDRNKIYFYAK